MEPRIRRKGGQQANRITHLRIIEYRGLQDYPIQIHTILVQQPREYAGARCTVRLAEQELWRVPAIEHGQVTFDELFDRTPVFIDAPKIAVFAWRNCCGVAGANGINEDQIGKVE